MYIICSLYLSPNTEISNRQLTILANQLPWPFLILGDLNGRHHFWGDVCTNTRGGSLLSRIESLDLTVLNTGEPTHFHIQTGSFSCIDLSVSSPNAFIDFIWKVLDDLHGSDHFPVLLTTGDAIPVTRAPRWCTDKANCPLFEELSHIEVDANEMPTVDEAIFYLNTIFINAGNHSIPKTSGKFHQKPVPWWDAQCHILHSNEGSIY